MGKEALRVEPYKEDLSTETIAYRKASKGFKHSWEKKKIYLLCTLYVLLIILGNLHESSHLILRTILWIRY